MSFQLTDLLSVLTPATLAMSVILGVVMGAILRSLGRRPPFLHTYWMLMGGIVFFVPISLIRMLEGVDTWERTAGTYLLWSVYVFAMMIGTMVMNRRRS